MYMLELGSPSIFSIALSNGSGWGLCFSVLSTAITDLKYFFILKVSNISTAVSLSLEVTTPRANPWLCNFLTISIAFS